jgi:uncharacterized delta-60 repeat protein
LNADGSLDTSFNPVLPTAGGEYGFCAMALQPDGKILVGGQFYNPDATLLRFNQDGTPDTSFNYDYDGSPQGNKPIMAIAVQPDGKIILAGDFDLVRLNPDGSRDTTFASPVSLVSPYAMALQGDGKIVGFSSIGMVRVNADGRPDTGFHNEVSWVWAVLLQPNGRILIGGSFSTVNGFPIRNIARLNGGSSTPICLLTSSLCPRTGQPQVLLTGPAGAVVLIEATSDLRSWTPLMTVTNTLSGVQVCDPAASGSPQRFYRVRLVE